MSAVLLLVEKAPCGAVGFLTCLLAMFVIP